MTKSYSYSQLGRSGRLGNQLWQIAWQVGSALRDGGQIYVNPDWEYRRYFSIPEAAYVKPSGRIVDGNLFYQELHHWDNAVDLVREYFQPSAESLTHLKSSYPDWFFDPSVNKTSIHIRAGDYLQYPTRFPVPSFNYYNKAIEEAGSETRFIVFSDDIEFARNKLNDANVDMTFIDGTVRPIEVSQRKGEPQDQWDLFLMTFCNQNIIANSTFSWWGAFLANSENVYYPSVWFGPDLDARDSRGIDVRKSWIDAMPTDWKKIQC